MKIDDFANFNQYFIMQPANTSCLLEDVFRLRYRVYCLELKWEAPNDTGLEIDQYDEYSSHYLIRHRASGEPAATVRLILQNPLGFPIQKSADIRLDAISNPAEASRFCVSENSSTTIWPKSPDSAFPASSNADRESPKRKTVSLPQ